MIEPMKCRYCGLPLKIGAINNGVVIPSCESGGCPNNPFDTIGGQRLLKELVNAKVGDMIYWNTAKKRYDKYDPKSD
jgi:hypothetical protein